MMLIDDVKKNCNYISKGVNIPLYVVAFSYGLPFAASTSQTLWNAFPAPRSSPWAHYGPTLRSLRSLVRGYWNGIPAGMHHAVAQ